MPESHHLPLALVLLAAAVVTVALFSRLRASPVLGYLVAGCIIGPGGFGLIHDTGSMNMLADMGVMFLLFIIGLELSWERLHAMRLATFFAGIAQVTVTGLVLAGIMFAGGFSPGAAIIIGGGLALSSTALVVQLLAERNHKASQLGRLTLAVLLVQDLAVVPLLALIPALEPGQAAGATLLAVGIKAAVALTLILFAGRILLRPLYRLIASQDNPEIFTALTLLVVLGTGWLTSYAGLSVALGAFMAGLIMAETEYRHQVEADVMPYKGLFLGLFFMTVGMSADLHVAWQQWPIILTLALGLMAIKALLMLGLFRSFRFDAAIAVKAALLLAQGGEFAFVLFKLAEQHGFIPPGLARMLTIVVAVSMALTPFAASAARSVTARMDHTRRRKAEDAMGEMADLRDHVIILGFGRVGQTIAKLLSAEGINYIALDMHIATVSRARKIGMPVYFGDGARREVLFALGVERAQAAIVTVNDPQAAEAMVRALRAVAPQMPIVARGHDLKRVMMLEAAGANVAISEMFETSLQLGGALLRSMGIGGDEIARIIELFRDRDYALARGVLEAELKDQETPYGKMLTFQKAAVKGAVIDPDDSVVI